MDKGRARTTMVTVLMPVYNGARYLAAAVESILWQSHADFELLVLDDGSTDGSGDIAEAYRDPRIRVVRNESNRGLVETRNRGIRESRGKYVAFLDSDDISLPRRLETQLRFLEDSPDFVMVGSRIALVDEQGELTGMFSLFEASPASFPSILLFDNYFAQSAVMVRGDALADEMYRQEFPCAEDYDLFARLALRGKTWTIPEVLTLYREHGGGMSKKRRDLIVECTKKIYVWQLRRLGIEPTQEELNIHGSLGCLAPDLRGYGMDQVGRWLTRLFRRNEQSGLYRRDEFNALILEKMALACVERGNALPNLLRYYFTFSGVGSGAKIRVLAKILRRRVAKKTYGLTQNIRTHA